MGLVDDAKALRARLDKAITAGETSEATRRVIADVLIAPQITAGTLSDDEVAARLAVFPAWTPDVDVTVGEFLAWDGTVVEVLQAHRTQADWTPDVVPALFRVFRKTAGPTVDEWKQPVGATDAYKKGDRVMFEGVVWESTAAANVWEPGVYGWKAVT